ncbi:hypothetical protein [Bacillus sp. JCM 19041]|uniref:hypothetical protein n=1 Tax=Bacillus sp. JCM 19041 TaxID=1460637 RepID=UPI0006D284EA
MNEITVFLFDYSNGQTLQKALYSLISLKHRIKTVYLLNPPTPFEPKAITDHVQAIFVPKKKLSDTLNALLQRCDSTYALFLQNNDTLSQSIRSKDLTLSASQSVMTINLQTGNHFMQYPFFTKTALFQKKNYWTSRNYPFQKPCFQPGSRQWKKTLYCKQNRNSSSAQGQRAQKASVKKINSLRNMNIRKQI